MPWGTKSERSNHAELGCHISHHRTHRRYSRTNGSSGGFYANRVDSLCRLYSALPGQSDHGASCSPRLVALILATKEWRKQHVQRIIAMAARGARQPDHHTLFAGYSVISDVLPKIIRASLRPALTERTAMKDRHRKLSERLPAFSHRLLPSPRRSLQLYYPSLRRPFP